MLAAHHPAGYLDTFEVATERVVHEGHCASLVALTESFQKALAAGQAHIPPIPVPRMGSLADDIVPVALFLVSPEAGYVTGYSYFADGGLMMDCAR